MLHLVIAIFYCVDEEYFFQIGRIVRLCILGGVK
jgi:hypothetical protein